ncbi:MAG: PAS domain-containing protein, partial [Chloroflexi bacterium]|nr:PAS domain-containing protein [Chloroflexota bacterium]
MSIFQKTVRSPWYLLRKQNSPFLAEAAPEKGDPFGLPGPDERLRQYAAWLINLRWMAAAMATALIVAACPLTHLLPVEAFLPLLACVGVLALLNFLFAWQAHRSQDPRRLVRFQILSDLAILTALLHFSGGIENPFFIAYGFHVTIAGIFLARRAAYGLFLVASGLFTLLAVGELTGLLSHYDIWPFDFLQKEDSVQHAAHCPLYVFGHLLPFVGFLFCTTSFITLIAGYLRRSEERLVEAARVVSAERQKLESVVHAAGIGMILLDRNLEVRWFNPRVREWFGWQKDRVGRRYAWYEAAGRTAVHPCIASQTVQTGEVLQAECILCEMPGRKRFYHVTTSPIRDEGGKIVQVVELVQEITARKVVEAEALHAGKMTILGQMAAGIAHEIGNPLSSLSTRLRRMEKHQDDEGFMGESLQILRDQIGRIGQIVRGVSQFARPSR